MCGFSVVVMMRESPDVVVRFVDYYLRLGASQIFIYYNGPAEEVPPVAGADVTVCTPAFWASRVAGPVSDALEDRQRICYRDAYARCTAGWLLVVDSDEFVFGDRPLAPLLDALPRSVESIYFPTAEAVWGPGDDPHRAFGCSYFRTGWQHLRLWDLLRRSIYGGVSDVMRGGVMGHAIGKHLVRTGLRDCSISGHRSKRGDKIISVAAASVSPDFNRFHLAHFDALSQSRWESKWRYRIEKVVVAGGMSVQRQVQMRMVADALAAGKSEALFRRFYGLTPWQYRTLALLGTAFRRKDFFGPETAAPPIGKPSLAA